MAKIIDDRGRLFGKINVIDFLMLLFLLCLTPMFYFGYKIIHKQPIKKSEINPASQQKPEIVEIDLNVILQKINPEQAGLIAIGDKQINEHSEITCEIVNLGEIRPYSYEINIGNTKKTIIDPVLKDLPATLRLKAELKQNSIYYAGQQINDNSVIDFKTGKYVIKALYISPLPIDKNLAYDPLDHFMRIHQKQKELEQEISSIKKKILALEDKISTGSAVQSMDNKQQKKR